MAKYRNLKTGAVFETASVCAGANWEEVKTADTKAPNARKTTAKKKDVKADE
jgi:hypothetical protein